MPVNTAASGTGGAALHGITAIDDLRAAVIRNPLGTGIILRWISGEITPGNMADRLKLQSPARPNVADANGTHEVAYLDDLIGNILFQFSVYSPGESRSGLPVINPERPPVVNEKAIVRNWSGGAWVFDSMIEKPDNYAWEWVVQHHRNHTYEHFATCYAIFSREELWSTVEVPLEMYRPFAERDTVDNNAKAWTRYGVNHIPDRISTRVPERITPAMTGVNGIGRNPPAEDRGGVILNKPPLLSDLYALNVLDAGSLKCPWDTVQQIFVHLPTVNRYTRIKLTRCRRDSLNAGGGREASRNLKGPVVPAADDTPPSLWYCTGEEWRRVNSMVTRELAAYGYVTDATPRRVQTGGYAETAGGGAKRSRARAVQAGSPDRVSHHSETTGGHAETVGDGAVGIITDVLTVEYNPDLAEDTAVIVTWIGEADGTNVFTNADIDTGLGAGGGA
jgi:hypothetical protein